MTNFRFLAVCFVLCLFVVPQKSFAQGSDNSSYFGYHFLHAAAKELHKGKDLRQMIETGEKNELLKSYTPEKIAEAYDIAWKKSNAYEKRRIDAFLSVKNTIPLHQFISTRQDWSLVETIKHQFSRVADEAINEATKGKDTTQLTGYKQLADTGLKAMIHVLYLMKRRGDPEYEEYKAQLPVVKEFIAAQWAEGAYLFARKLKLDNGISSDEDLAMPYEDLPFVLNTPSTQDSELYFPKK